MISTSKIKIPITNLPGRLPCFIMKNMMVQVIRKVGLAGTVNGNLISLAGISDISAAFIMNKDGLCILSSATKFIGKNYGFRPYFKQALKSGFGLYAARGVTSGKIGIYYSVAMYSDSRIIGVAVLKFSPSFSLVFISKSSTARL